MSNRFGTFSGIIITILLLTGCDNRPPPESMLSNYLQRIANVQQQEAIEPTEPEISIPRRRALFQEPSRQTIGILETLQLTECQLMTLVAERNTVLGKVQDQFRNLEYQYALLKGLRDCLSTQSLSDELVSKLDAIYAIKWQELPIHISNLLYTSDAMYAQAYSSRWYSDDDKAGLYELSQLLTQLTRLRNGHRETSLPDAFDIVHLQEAIEKNDQLGRLTYSLKYATRYLNATKEQLYRYDSGIFCGANRDPTKYRRLKNVFQQFYLGEVQPYLADLNSAYFLLSPHIDLFYEPTLNMEYHHAIQTAYTEYKQASQQHAQYWIALFKRCGERVGNNP